MVSKVALVANAERLFQSATDLIRGNPIVSTAAIGIGTTGLVAGAAAVRRRKSTRKKTTRKKTTRKKRKTPVRRKKRTKAQIKAMRLRNLAKARRARKKGGKRKIIRGPGLGSREIKHSGRGTKGKTKLVSFKTKNGKTIRFKRRKK